MKLTLVTRLLLALCLTLLASSLSFSEANDHQLADNAIKRLIKSRSRSKNSPAALPRSFKKIINFNARKEYSPAVRSSIYQPQTGSMEQDKINALPGQPNGIGFNQYAGYVTVDAQAGRALFYYFVESPENSSTNPLVLWLNGGMYINKNQYTYIHTRIYMYVPLYIYKVFALFTLKERKYNGRMSKYIVF